MMSQPLDRLPFDLNGKTAFVTGAATGLGAAISAALARSGADVAISDKLENSLDETAAAIEAHDRSPLRLALDVRDFAQMPAVVEQVERHFGRLDILVNNAGINRPAAGLEVTAAEWDDHFTTNVKGGFFLAQAAARGMIDRGRGRVIFISSQSGPGRHSRPAGVLCHQGSSESTSANARHRMGGIGRDSQCSAPTFVETNLTRRRLENPEFRRFVLGNIPSGRLATADHVAAAVVYLASDEAAMLNCDVLRVDGGWTAW